MSMNVNAKTIENMNPAPHIRMPLIRVKTKANTGHLVPTSAFIDSASSAIFCTKNFLNKLFLSSVTLIQLSVSALRPDNINMDCVMVNSREICDVDENCFLTLKPVYRMEEIFVSKG